MKCAIAIFAKTIGLSSVKTRLAASIGKENAEQFYRLSVVCVEEVLQDVVRQNPNIFPYWFLAEEEAPLRSEWRSFPAMWTGEGELGDRLANVSNMLFEDHDVVFLIGTDSPQMSAKYILQSIESLEANPYLDHISGSAKDGGFWLWGSRKTLPDTIWNNVTYSASTTLEELIAATNTHGDHVHIGHEMQDVDMLEDLITLQKILEQKEGILLSAQKILLEWVKENNPTFQV